MDDDEVLSLLRVIARLEKDRRTWEQRAVVLKEMVSGLEEQLNELRAGQVVHSDERAGDNAGSGPSNGSSRQADNGGSSSSVLSESASDS
jgi:hypothetical protein